MCGAALVTKRDPREAARAKFGQAFRSHRIRICLSGDFRIRSKPKVLVDTAQYSNQVLGRNLSRGPAADEHRAYFARVPSKRRASNGDLGKRVIDPRIS